jgi:hypothetical protein
VVGLQLAVVLLFNVVRKLVRRVPNQPGRRRLLAMAQRLHLPGYRQRKLVIPVELPKECVLQVLVRGRRVVQEPAVQADLAERRSRRHKCESSHSWVICSSADLSM